MSYHKLFIICNKWIWSFSVDRHAQFDQHIFKLGVFPKTGQLIGSHVWNRG